VLGLRKGKMSGVTGVSPIQENYLDSKLESSYTGLAVLRPDT
jgi:hypothetical protein